MMYEDGLVLQEQIIAISSACTFGKYIPSEGFPSQNTWIHQKN